jgi:spore coat protein CotF
MASLINNLLGKENSEKADQVIANSGLASAKAAATAYLAAALESTTPELRRLYAEYLNQSIAGHEGLMNLAINMKWYNPYETPEQQLDVSYHQSQRVVQPTKQ